MNNYWRRMDFFRLAKLIFNHLNIIARLNERLAFCVRVCARQYFSLFFPFLLVIYSGKARVVFSFMYIYAMYKAVS